MFWTAWMCVILQSVHLYRRTIPSSLKLTLPPKHEKVVSYRDLEVHLRQAPELKIGGGKHQATESQPWIEVPFPSQLLDPHMTSCSDLESTKTATLKVYIPPNSLRHWEGRGCSLEALSTLLASWYIPTYSLAYASTPPRPITTSYSLKKIRVLNNDFTICWLEGGTEELLKPFDLSNDRPRCVASGKKEITNFYLRLNSCDHI